MFRVSFFTEDRHLAEVMHAITGKAKGLEVVPVVNAAPSGNGVKQKAGNTLELFEQEIRKRKLSDFGAGDARAICKAVGLAESGYGSYIKRLIEMKVLKKSGSKGQMVYNLVRD